MDGTSPKFKCSPAIEWRAERIRDPIERLKYLRRAMGEGPPAVSPAPGRVRFGRWRGPLLIALLTAALVPVQTISDASFPRVVAAGRSSPLRNPPPPANVTLIKPSVWLVEKTSAYETYSNGLRIETGFTTSHSPRSYPVFERRGSGALPDEWRTAPAGIVYHTTESNLAPFEPRHNGKLKQIGQALLDLVCRNRSYHYLIDRFGRVFRVVDENDVANHAGWSVWADDRWLFVNLNRSFLGVSFEAQSATENGEASVNRAQIHSARILTELLRTKYAIPSRNCVTHAQVSVNPRNGLIGYHIDWADRFPFAEIGLEDNYLQTLPSVFAFGFDYNSAFLKSTGTPLREALARSENELRGEADARGLTAGAVKAALQNRYQRIVEALENKGADEENKNESK